MSPRVRALLAGIDAARFVAGYLELDPDEALDGVVLDIDEAAAAGAGLSASGVRELQTMLQDYRAQYAQRLELDLRMHEAVDALLIELQHPCPARCRHRHS